MSIAGPRSGALAREIVPVPADEGLESLPEDLAIEAQRVLTAAGLRVGLHAAFEAVYGLGQGPRGLLAEQQARVSCPHDVDCAPVLERDDRGPASLGFGHDDSEILDSSEEECACPLHVGPDLGRREPAGKRYVAGRCTPQPLHLRTVSD